LPLPDKPSIAVLPFANMSGDPEQEYFADGMVEEIITALSRIRWLFVIARNSTFTYKSQAIDVKRVGPKQPSSTVEPATCVPYQLLLGHTKIESTVRHLGIEVDDALAIAEQVDV
jgi:hypothetical protein